MMSLPCGISVLGWAGGGPDRQRVWSIKRALDASQIPQTSSNNPNLSTTTFDSQTNFTSTAPSTPPVSPSSTAITLPDDIPNYDQVPPRIPFQDTINEWVG